MMLRPKLLFRKRLCLPSSRSPRSAACLFIAAFFFSTATSSAWSHDKVDTIAKIRENRVIVIGSRLEEPPFSYVIDGKTTGYATELCNRVVKEMQVRLKLPELEIRYVPVTTATRFVMVRTGKIDMECAATTNTAERRKLVAFSYPNFVTATRFVSLRKNHFKRVADLAGRTVAATTGTVNVEQLYTVNRARGLNISVLLSKENSDSFALVSSGKASAFVMDDILLAGLVAASPNPEAYVISPEAFSHPEPYGILLPLGDEAFKEAVNTSLRHIYRSGEIYDLYSKWFERPIPPNNQNMRMQISPELRAIFDNPREYLD
ncbi:amino acid ABC transporter substrate-binding protein [Rhizobium helianthi]|uniref:Amino acid ABC transporter substrate-binding protein n=1 Tax=Rhizobium helianthi TaxID=1132695 RepID=A0ABW4M1R2_9HYPH